MCQYCDEKSNNAIIKEDRFENAPSFVKGLESEAWIEYDEEHKAWLMCMTYDCGYGVASVPIKNCPMCGKELK